MNRLKHILTLTLLVLLATACSKDDDLTSGGNIPTDDAGQQTVTFTVGADYTLEGDARTRSEGTEEEKPTRCFLQVLDAGGTNLIASASDDTPDDKGAFQLSVSGLATGTTYQFLFWADNASTTISDLKAVPYMPNTVAYAFKDTNTPEQINKKITLSHVVTKVTLRHNSTTNTFTASAGSELTLTIPYLTTYDVSSDTQSGTGTQTIEHTFTAAVSGTANYDICTFYTLAPAASGNSVSVNFNMLDLVISGVSLPANNHVILQGDLSEYNTNWTIEEGKEAEYIRQRIEHYFYNDTGLFGNNNQTEPDKYYYYGTQETALQIIKDIFRENYTGSNTGNYNFDGHSFSYYCNFPMYANITFTDNNRTITVNINLFDTNLPSVTY